MPGHVEITSRVGRNHLQMGLCVLLFCYVPRPHRLLRKQVTAEGYRFLLSQPLCEHRHGLGHAQLSLLMLFSRACIIDCTIFQLTNTAI